MTEQGSIIWEYLFSAIKILGIALIIKWIFFPRKRKLGLKAVAQPEANPAEKIDEGTLNVLGISRSELLIRVGDRIALATGELLLPKAAGQPCFVIYGLNWRDEADRPVEMNDNDIHKAIEVLSESLTPEHPVEIDIYGKPSLPKIVPDSHN